MWRICGSTKTLLFTCSSRTLTLLHSSVSTTLPVASSVRHQWCGDRVRRYSSATLPSQAEVVICGGGIIGCSVAYHLAKLGWKDVILLEQGQLTCGTTWHAAGLIGKMRGTASETKLSDYGHELYCKLEEETGLGTGFKQNGGVTIARTKERMTVLKRQLSRCRGFNIDAEIISPSEVQKMCPHIITDDILGGLWVPQEGVANPSDITQSLARGAVMNGVKIHERVQVEKVLTDGQKVQGVKTDRGDIKCDVFVNCAGQWARDLGLSSNPEVRVPLHSAEHYYIVTKAIEGIHTMSPTVRDPDGGIYVREWSGGIMAGGFEPVAKPCFHQGVPPKFEFQLLPEDWDHFEVLLREMLHRCPPMETAEVRQMINGPESFSPDGHYIMGEAPELRKYYVLAGMNSSGIASGGGAGKALAEWITAGEPTMDLGSVDIRRFGPHHNNKSYLRHRVEEVVGWHYSLRYPYSEKKKGRNVRCSPLHAVLSATGAEWGEKMGWERANWYNLSDEDFDKFKPKSRTSDYVFGKPSWFRNVEIEYRAFHESVGLVDMSSMGIFELQSNDSGSCRDFLQRLSARDVDVPVGHVIQTAMLNEQGGYELECTLARIEKERYVMLVPTSHITMAECWIKRNIPEGRSVSLRSLQSGYAVLGVLGPKATELLQSLTLTSLTKDDYPIDTVKKLDLGCATGVEALRRTSVGDQELGWQLLVPTELAVSLYHELFSEGSKYGIRNVGCHALGCLRVEKGYPLLGKELTAFVTPFEAGMANRVDLQKKTNFIGKKALISKQNKPLYNRLVFMAMEKHDDDNIPWGGEPIVREGEIVGFVSSASYSFILDQPVCLGYISRADEPVDQKYIQNKGLELDIAGSVYPVRTVLHNFKEQSTQSFLNGLHGS